MKTFDIVSTITDEVLGTIRAESALAAMDEWQEIHSNDDPKTWTHIEAIES